MATFNPRKFSDPSWLQRIAPARLIAFLQPWSGYLSHRGLAWPAAGSDAIDCAALAEILLSPNDTTPAEMADALYYVHETCTAADMESLIDSARRERLALDAAADTTPADLAIEIWLKRPQLLQQRHAEVLAHHQRSFEYFAGRAGTGRTFPHLGAVLQGQIEASLDDWFSENRRGRGSRIFVFREQAHTWIVIRHGEPMHREPKHADDGRVETAFYRPQQHDVLIYDETTDEIAVNAKTKGMRMLYLETIGRLVFGDPTYFPTADKFTLNPLIERGAEALKCDDIVGIDRVTLVEYRRRWGGAHKETEIRRADDIFAARADRGRSLALEGQLSAAVFRIKFSTSPKERRVVLRPKASAQCERDSDAVLIEEWLQARGFMRRAPAAEALNDEAA